MKVCTFSGHRPQKFPWKFDESDKRCVELKKQLHLAIGQAIIDGYDYFITGGALGLDMWAAEAVLKYKNENELKLEIAKPFDSYNDNLRGEYQRRQQYILQNAAKITAVDTRENWKKAYMLRNQYMINQSGRLIVAMDSMQTRSGAAQTLRMAEKAGLEIVRLNWAEDVIMPIAGGQD